MKISIALACYNGEQYISQQLTSTLKQSWGPDEVVICDDCSTDRTWEIVNQFACNVPFEVKLIRNKHNIGYTRNFSKALTNCSGDIIFMCDQDDVWHQHKITSVLEHFERNPQIQLVIHDLAFCDEHLKPTGESKIRRLGMFHNLQRDYVTGMATAVSSKFMRLCLPIPYKYVTHDAWIHLCAYYAHSKSTLPSILASYRRHQSNATSGSLINHPTQVRKTSVLLDLIIAKANIDFKQSIKRHVLLKAWLIRNNKNLSDNFGASAWRIQKSIASLQIKIYALKLIYLSKCIFTDSH